MSVILSNKSNQAWLSPGQLTERKVNWIPPPTSTKVIEKMGASQSAVLPKVSTRDIHQIQSCPVEVRSMQEFWRSKTDEYKYLTEYKQALLPPARDCPVGK